MNMRKTGPMAKSPLLRKPEPGTFEHLLRPVDVPARSMVRLSRRPLSEPWFGRSASGRFDDPLGQFGVCYAADDTATAFAETILHESALFLGGQYVVMAGDLASRWVVTLRRPKRTKLRLADLTGEALKALGLNNDISATDDYARTQAWARAIHDADAGWDGLRYVSRQLNDRCCYAVFERSGASRQGSVRLEGPLLDDLCTRFGVVGV
jgi:hypothetical protein